MLFQNLDEGFASKFLVEGDEVGTAEVCGFTRPDGFLLSIAYIILAVPVAQFKEGSTLLVHYLVFVTEGFDAARIPRYAEVSVGPVFFCHADGGLGVVHGSFLRFKISLNSFFVISITSSDTGMFLLSKYKRIISSFNSIKGTVKRPYSSSHPNISNMSRK